MKILIRVDVHPKIGFGHLSRCLNLAEELTFSDHKITFIGRGIRQYVKERSNSYRCYELPMLKNDSRTLDTSTWLGTTELEDVQICKNILSSAENTINYWDWIIVDHYAIGWKWELAISMLTKKIMVIDDLANRKHQCQLLLDQTPINQELIDDDRYRSLVPKDCKCLLGSEYVLLKHDYSDYRQIRITNQASFGKLKKILINFGSSDLQGQTKRVMQAFGLILEHNQQLKNCIEEIHVICGQLYKDPEHLYEIANTLKGFQGKRFMMYNSLSSEDQIKIISDMDLCLGAAGISLYERCCLGIPSILICVADNQEGNALAFETLGISSYLGKYDQWTIENLEEKIIKYLDHRFWMVQSEGGQQMVDGFGTRRVRNQLEQFQL